MCNFWTLLREKFGARALKKHPDHMYFQKFKKGKKKITDQSPIYYFFLPQKIYKKKYYNYDRRLLFHAT